MKTKKLMGWPQILSLMGWPHNSVDQDRRGSAVGQAVV